MARTLIAVLIGCVLTGCGASAVTPPAPQPATVTGTVRVSPCRPVERLGDPPCPPAAGIAIEFVPTGGGATLRTTTDAGGQYRISLGPGSYQARPSRGLGRNPQQVSVSAGQTLQLDLTFDVGIR